MNEKITYRSNGKGIGNVCVEIVITNLYLHTDPIIGYNRVMHIVKTQMNGKWLVGLYQHRIPLVIKGILSTGDLKFAMGMIDEFNKRYDSDLHNLPSQYVLEISDASNFTREDIKTMRDSISPVYISLIDRNGKLSVDYIESLLEVNFGTNRANPIDYTLVLDDISIIEFEEYKAIKQDVLLKFEHKLVRAYVVDSSIDVLAFAFDFNFRYTNPIRDDFSTFYNIVTEIRDNIRNYGLTMDRLTKLISEEK